MQTLLVVAAAWQASALVSLGRDRAVCGSHVRSLRLPLVKATAVADATKTDGKSALIFGWFHASEKELAFVRKSYEKQGFTDVVVLPSRISEISRPRGWYRTYMAWHLEQAAGGSALAREFDVVHAMSGGFLHLYLLRAAGIELEWKTLVLDSTPILPTPDAFTLFTRSYLRENGMSAMLRLFPNALHAGYVRARWFTGSLYCRTKHKLLRRDHRPKFGPSVGAWMRRISRGIMRDEHEANVDETLRVVFDTGFPMDVVFLYNPQDPFVDQGDLRRCIDRATNLGCAVHELTVPCKHISTLFRRPKAIFEKLESLRMASAADPEEPEATTGAARPPEPETQPNAVVA